MKFTSASLVNETIWNMRLADLPRATNRASVNRLMNGLPPYTERERQENNIEVNVNFLDAPQLMADARRSYYNGFQAPGKFFTVTIDSGPVYSRQKYGRIITSELNKLMKSSRLYSEVLDSQFAAVTLHGVGPAVWVCSQKWVPEEKGIEDVLIPGDTLRSMRNCDHLAVFYQYTPEQLYRMTHGPKVDPAWNMPMVEAALEWAHNQTQSMLSYNDMFAPEKIEERFKQDLGFFGTDAVPTIDFWKFFYHEDKGKESGWRMKMVIDTPGDWEVAGGRRPRRNQRMSGKNLVGMDNSQYLYDPKDRIYASDLEQLIHFQFGDLSAVSPFKYHSIRALGWLLYALCHLQNRMVSRYNEAVFESLLQYFRGNEGDKTRVQKVDLINYGFVPDGLAFVRPEERWQVNEKLVESAIDRNRQRMEYSAAQYRQGRDFGANEKEKTATQIMAEVNSAMSMVGSMLTQAYRYQTYQYREIARRFCIKNSIDPDVRTFRARVLHRNVPEKFLNSALWNIEPEKVLGGGNKTLQIAMADSLMAMRPVLDPESQRLVDRINIGAKADNDELAERLVPEIRTVSDALHDAANSFGTLMLGGQVPLKTGINHVDAIEILLANMAMALQQMAQTGPNMEKLAGLGNVAQHIGQHIQILAQNPMEKRRVRDMVKRLKQLLQAMQQMRQALVKQMQKAAQAAQQGQGGMDPKDAAKIQGMLMMAKVKADNMEKSHAARTAQKQLSWEKEEMRKDQEHQIDMRRQLDETAVDNAAKDLVTASEIRRGGMRSLQSEGD